MVNARKWVRNSAKTRMRLSTELIFTTFNRFNNEFSKKQSKHTFFPGNEIGSRSSFNQSYILDCDSIYKVIWDIMVMLLTVALSYLIPFSLSFHAEYDKLVTDFIIIIYLFDMFLTFNTTYYSKGVKVSNRLKIAKHYLKFWFWFDSLSSFPFDYLISNYTDKSNGDPEYTNLLSNDGLRYLLYFKLLRLFKFKRLIFNIQQVFSFPFIYNLTSLFTYLYGVTLILHLVTCFYNYLYSNSLFEEPLRYQMIEADRKTRYLRFFLRAMETVVGVGYGEFPANTVNEKIVQIFVMTMTSGLLGYIVGGVEATVEKLNHVDYYFNDVIRKAKIFFSLNKCPKDIKVRVLNYIRNLKVMHAQNLIKEQDVLSFLSTPMREEVYASLQGHFLKRLNEFNIVSGTCLRSISYHLKLQMFGPSDVIIDQGETTRDLYFVVGGTVEVFHKSTKTMFKILGKHSYFGEISFFIKQPRAASVRSFDYSEVLKVSSHDFFNILKSLPRDREKIEVLLRNIKRYGVSFLNIRCYLCLVLGHTASSCEKYTYKKKFDVSFFKADRVPDLGFPSRKYNFYKRFGKQSVKGTEQDPEDLFKESQNLISFSKNYMNWKSIFIRKSNPMISLLGSLEDIDEDNEDHENIFEIKVQTNRMIGSCFLNSPDNSPLKFG